MKRIAVLLSVVTVLALVGWRAEAQAHKVDPVHSFVVFRIGHANIGYVWGRFNDPAGSFTLDDADPAKSSFEIEIKVANVDTHQPKRDEHLQTPDFFNAKQYPTITFKSTSVKKGSAANTLDVTGDLTMHGVTKSVTIPVERTSSPPRNVPAGLRCSLTCTQRTGTSSAALPARTRGAAARNTGRSSTSARVGNTLRLAVVTLSRD